MIKFSVVIPLYNKEKEIEDAITSVLNQSYSHFEIIVIDDGSTDASAQIVGKINDDRVKLISKKNEGVSIARNFGVENVNSENIVFLDADDYWYPNHLEDLQLLIHSFPNNKWFATAYEKKRNKKLTTPMSSPILKNGGDWYGEVSGFFENSFVDSLVNSSTICFKKSFFTSLKGFNAFYTHGEDTDLWIRAALNEKLVFSNKISVLINLDSSNRSRDIPNHKRVIFDVNKFIKEEVSNPTLKKYLDLNRYSQLINFKIVGGNQRISKEYIKGIDLNNLNKKQRFLLKQNKFILKLLVSSQNLLEKLGIRFSSF